MCYLKNQNYGLADTCRLIIRDSLNCYDKYY